MTTPEETMNYLQRYLDEKVGSLYLPDEFAENVQRLINEHKKLCKEYNLLKDKKSDLWKG